MTRLFKLLACSFVLAVVPVHAAQVTPTIAVDAASIVGSAFAPGHEVVIFGAANVPQPYYARLVDYLQVVTVDASGTFRWTPGEAISPRSIWFAVDLSSAEYCAAYPAAGNPPVSSLPAPSVHASRDAQNDVLSTDEYTVKMLLVHANDAVWTGSPMRHGSSDLNQGNPGSMDIDLSQLRNVRGNKHFAGHLVPSDFVVLIDPVSLRFYAGRPSSH